VAKIELSELVAPGRTALILQEVQEGILGETSALPALAESARRVGLVEHAAQLATAARKASVPVIHCTAENLPGGFGQNHNARLFAGALKAGAENLPGTESVMPMHQIGVERDDVVLPRYHGLAPMTGTQLDSLLRNSGISSLVVAGVSLNVAITNLVFDAVNRSYQVVVPTDAVAGFPLDYGEQVLEHSLRLVATLTSTKEIADLWGGPG